jgi:hypothetical protein
VDLTDSCGEIPLISRSLQMLCSARCLGGVPARRPHLDCGRDGQKLDAHGCVAGPLNAASCAEAKVGVRARPPSPADRARVKGRSRVAASVLSPSERLPAHRHAHIPRSVIAQGVVRPPSRRRALREAPGQTYGCWRGARQPGQRSDLQARRGGRDHIEVPVGSRAKLVQDPSSRELRIRITTGLPGASRRSTRAPEGRDCGTVPGNCQTRSMIK